MITSRTTRSLGAVAGLAIAALTLSACGDGPTSPDDASAADRQTDAAPAPEDCDTPDELTVVRTLSTAFEILYIADDAGIFEKHCLDVTINLGATDTAQNIPMVLNGEADVAYSDPAKILGAIAQGLPIKVAVQHAAGDASQEVADGVLLPPGSPVETGADLEGRNVCVPGLGGWTEMLARWAVDVDGGDHTKVDLVALPGATLQESAETGACDAIVPASIHYATALEAGFTRLHNGTNDFPGLPTMAAAVSTAWAAENADVLARFVQALAEASELANADVQLVRDVDAEHTQLDPEVVATRFIPKFQVELDIAATQEAVDLMYEYGIFSAPVDVAAAVADGALTK
ncbi:ABC transporter substrate-binding protein [Microbacterium album]|uniref:SsuA/THI5-like domain-containing protein n=1 Tax=Microbacterium album TaxID=2053191 RepID=A0A917IIR6_9MICO|nr:ABC transporter substrate-binding protein [Microbacterium album]GGH48447.1 hypothetical protein GCM10010921_25920 [Microbacterium album]